MTILRRWACACILSVGHAKNILWFKKVETAVLERHLACSGGATYWKGRAWALPFSFRPYLRPRAYHSDRKTKRVKQVSTESLKVSVCLITLQKLQIQYNTMQWRYLVPPIHETGPGGITIDGYKDAFYELCRLTKIACAFPITTASAERSFSAPKIFKTYM